MSVQHVASLLALARALKLMQRAPDTLDGVPHLAPPSRAIWSKGETPPQGREKEGSSPGANETLSRTVCPTVRCTEAGEAYNQHLKEKIPRSRKPRRIFKRTEIFKPNTNKSAHRKRSQNFSLKFL